MAEPTARLREETRNLSRSVAAKEERSTLHESPKGGPLFFIFIQRREAKPARCPFYMSRR